MTERERKELNNQGILILNTKAIGYSRRLAYEGELLRRTLGYDELRKVSKFKVNHFILEDHG